MRGQTFVILIGAAFAVAWAAACDTDAPAARPPPTTITPGGTTYPALPLDYSEGEVPVPQYRSTPLPADEHGQAWRRVTFDGVSVDLPGPPWREQIMADRCHDDFRYILVLQHDGTGDRMKVDVADKTVTAVFGGPPERLTPLIERIERSFAGERIIPTQVRRFMPQPTEGPCDPADVPTLAPGPTAAPWPSPTPEPWPFERIAIEGVSVDVPTGPAWRAMVEVDPCFPDGRKRYVLQHQSTGVLIAIDMAEMGVSAQYTEPPSTAPGWLDWLTSRIQRSFSGRRQVPPDVATAMPLPTSPACDPGLIPTVPPDLTP
ncbi:MAG TPA: hypothetical protein VNM43_12045 [Dehalococcoidia bacterium]|nr:hypothetical protein [Dehalococcoidia bacterium]